MEHNIRDKAVCIIEDIKYSMHTSSNALFSRKHSKLNTDESGRSMVEMLGVLAIIGVLSVGGLAGYTMAMRKYRSNKSITEMQLLFSNIRTLYLFETDYSSLTLNILKESGVVTSDMLNAAEDQAVNDYGGNINFASVNSDKGFTIEYTGLPQNACTQLATGDWGSTEMLVSIKIIDNTPTTYTYTWGDATRPLPVPLDQALTDCSESSSVLWEYK